jgi:hypothetical protein
MAPTIWFEVQHHIPQSLYVERCSKNFSERIISTWKDSLLLEHVWLYHKKVQTDKQIYDKIFTKEVKEFFFLFQALRIQRNI